MAHFLITGSCPFSFVLFLHDHLRRLVLLSILFILSTDGIRGVLWNRSSTDKHFLRLYGGCASSRLSSEDSTPGPSCQRMLQILDRLLGARSSLNSSFAPALRVSFTNLNSIDLSSHLAAKLESVLWRLSPDVSMPKVFRMCYVQRCSRRTPSDPNERVTDKNHLTKDFIPTSGTFFLEPHPYR